MRGVIGRSGKGKGGGREGEDEKRGDGDRYIDAYLCNIVRTSCSVSRRDRDRFASSGWQLAELS